MFVISSSLSVTPSHRPHAAVPVEILGLVRAYGDAAADFEDAHDAGWTRLGDPFLGSPRSVSERFAFLRHGHSLVGYVGYSLGAGSNVYRYLTDFLPADVLPDPWEVGVVSALLVSSSPCEGEVDVVDPTGRADHGDPAALLLACACGDLARLGARYVVVDAGTSKGDVLREHALLARSGWTLFREPLFTTASGRPLVRTGRSCRFGMSLA